jgi:hypothetical protein
VWAGESCSVGAMAILPGLALCRRRITGGTWSLGGPYNSVEDPSANFSPTDSTKLLLVDHRLVTCYALYNVSTDVGVYL